MSTQPPARPSGLRNPAAAVRGVGAGVLVLEGLGLLLAIAPMVVVGDGVPGVAVAGVVGLALVCVALAGLMKHRWAWGAVFMVQLALAGLGLAYFPALVVVALLFGVLWLYALSMRRRVLG